MEKDSHFPMSEEEEMIQQREERRWRVIAAAKRVHLGAVFFIFSFACIWLAHMTGGLSLPTTPHRICKWPLSVEERAANILKKNPLIGWCLD